MYLLGIHTEALGWGAGGVEGAGGGGSGGTFRARNEELALADHTCTKLSSRCGAGAAAGTTSQFLSS